MEPVSTQSYIVVCRVVADACTTARPINATIHRVESQRLEILQKVQKNLGRD